MKLLSEVSGVGLVLRHPSIAERRRKKLFKESQWTFSLLNQIKDLTENKEQGDMS